MTLATVLFGAVASATTPNMGVATLAYFSMLCGLIFRKDRRAHSLFMGSAMVLDLGLVLLLQLTRNAVGTAAGGALNPMQLIHIGTSLIALLLYVPLTYLGMMARLQKSTASMRRNHRLLGMGTFLFRTVGFLSMFSMLTHRQG
jgi:hypothetical protein